MEINLDFSWWPFIQGILIGLTYWFVFFGKSFEKTSRSIRFFNKFCWLLFPLLIAAGVLLGLYIFVTIVSGSFFIAFWGMLLIPFLSAGIRTWLAKGKKASKTISYSDLEDMYTTGYFFCLIYLGGMLIFSSFFIIRDLSVYKSSGKIVVCEFMKKTRVVTIEKKDYVLYMEKNRGVLKPVTGANADKVRKSWEVYRGYLEKGWENPVIVAGTKKEIQTIVTDIARNEKIPSRYISLEEAQKLLK